MKDPYTISTQDTPSYKQLISGRTEDLETILDHIANGHSIALFGERRIGKTSLLFLLRDIINGHIDQYMSNLVDVTLKLSVDVLKAKVPFKFKAVYVSLQEIERPEQAALADALYQACCDAGWIHVSPGRNHLLPAQRDPLPPRPTTILSFFRMLQDDQEERHFVLLIDEIEGLQDFADNKQIARNLRSIIQSSPQICMILAGAEGWYNQIKDKTSPLVHNVHTFYLKAPSRSSVEAYLVKEQLRVHLPPSYEISAMARTIMLWTESKAFYVQAICGSIVERKYDVKGEVPDDWEKEVEESVFTRLKPTLTDFFTGINLDIQSRNILALLANKPGLTDKQIAVHLGYSIKTIDDKLNDLICLDKVSKHREGYRIVGTLIEDWGKSYQDIPSKKPSRVKWLQLSIVAIIIIAVILLYFYIHPNTQTYSFVIPNGVFSIQMPSSLEQDDTGTALVAFQNTSTQTINAVHIFLNSSTIDFQQGGTSEMTFQEIAPDEKKFLRITYAVHSTGNTGLLISEVLITGDSPTSTVTRPFFLTERPIPLEKIFIPLSSIITALGIVSIYHKNLWQFLASLVSLLQGKVPDK